MIRLGMSDSRITVLRNGVDLQLFHPPQDREALRQTMRLTRKTLLFVGNLVPEKGIDLCIRALALLPETDLIIIGRGPQQKPLEALASELRLSSHVKFLGPLNQEQLPDYYGAADALVLASGREGWPNVILESLACGTPVAATHVGGVPEIIAAQEAGIVIAAASPGMLADGICRLWSQPPDRSATRRYAERFGWDETTKGQILIFREVIGLQSFSH
jgi:teichuronic acid biosynthesis glycosyltransferase TuaC